jgi:hypothetical protein
LALLESGVLMASQDVRWRSLASGANADCADVAMTGLGKLVEDIGIGDE